MVFIDLPVVGPNHAAVINYMADMKGDVPEGSGVLNIVVRARAVPVATGVCCAPATALCVPLTVWA